MMRILKSFVRSFHSDFSFFKFLNALVNSSSCNNFMVLTTMLYWRDRWYSNVTIAGRWRPGAVVITIVVVIIDTDVTIAIVIAASARIASGSIAVRLSTGRRGRRVRRVEIAMVSTVVCVTRVHGWVQY